MKILRPICLLLAGVSLLVVMACGMTLYILQIGESSGQFHQSFSQDMTKHISEARDVAAVRDLCLPLARAFSAQSNTLHEQGNLWHNILLAGLCWAVLSAIMFAWVFAVMRNAELQAPAGLEPAVRRRAG